MIYKVLYDYKPQESDEVALLQGDHLFVYKRMLLEKNIPTEEPNDWIFGENERTKKTGFFPCTYVKYVGERLVAPPRPAPRPSASSIRKPANDDSGIGESPLKGKFYVNNPPHMRPTHLH